MIKGCITAIVTPMLKDESIDYESLTNLVEWQIENKVAGIVVNGTTGESASLSTPEKLQLIQHIISINQGRVKIIVGVGLISTVATMDFVNQLAEIFGIDYLLCVTPYYIRPTQEGLYLHFAKIAEVSPIPIILYNVPQRTACDLSNETILQLANDFENIVGIKDATGNLKRSADLLEHKPESFMLFSGDDSTAVDFILQGGDGVISVVSNIYPRLFGEMCNLALKGKSQKALDINQELYPLYSLLFCEEANPIPVKWGLFYKGYLSTSTLRLPLRSLSSNYQSRLKAFLNSTA